MQRAASNLALLGFDVYMPILDSVEALRLHPATVDEIAGFLAALVSHKRSKVGVFSASISASLSIVACARPELRKNISGIMAIGPYGHLKRAVSHVMHNSRDDYGRFVIWMNFSDWIVGHQPGLNALFRTAIDDDGWKRQHPHLPAQLAQADPQTRALFRRFVYDKTYREMRWQQVCQQFQENQDWVRWMNPADHIQQLSAPLFLLHGEKDDVILPAESEDLYQLLKRYNRPGKCLLSPLISHADLEYTWKTPLNGLQLMGLFARFFDQVWINPAKELDMPGIPQGERLSGPARYKSLRNQPVPSSKTGFSSMFKVR
jgi:pimeloyl-ACP methyl ester carboxylesterase